MLKGYLSAITDIKNNDRKQDTKQSVFTLACTDEES